MTSSPGQRGSDGLAADLERDLREGAGRNAVYRRLLVALAPLLEEDAGARIAAAWSARTFHAWFDRPRLLLAALRFDALEEGTAHPLWRALGPGADPAAISREALEDALSPRRARLWDALATRLVQTNETSRAVTWLWPALLAGCDAGARPLALLDVGASAGLNLVADALPAPWTDEAGGAVPVARAPDVVARVGLDASPLDVRSGDAARWLRALVWPGESARLQRLDDALAALRRLDASGDGPVLERCRARDAPARAEQLASAHPGALALAYQCVVREYIGAPERDEYERGMDAWLLGRPAGSAAWLQLEHADEGATREWPSWIVARWRDGGSVRGGLLARCGYHPSVLRLEPDGMTAFQRSFS